MAKNTRLATTLTARYLPGAGAVDAFYLDGRMNGVRERNFADITLDREERAAFLAIYASSHGSELPGDGADGNKELLDRISQGMKQNARRKIDLTINDLAETAVGVTGRLTLADRMEDQPYFAGLLVKDGEIAAVTMGRACAYLYRDDALFPLTQDDLGFEAVDYYGKTLPNMHDFAAGVAGTIRYSNIAQLKPNDCLILCNRELMEIVGQRRMLQLLDRAEDQCDAAGMVMGLATHEDNRMNLQFMISFVEDLIPIDRLGRSTLARGFAKLQQTGRLFTNAAERQAYKEALQEAEAQQVAQAAQGHFENFKNQAQWAAKPQNQAQPDAGLARASQDLTAGLATAASAPAISSSTDLPSETTEGPGLYEEQAQEARVEVPQPEVQEVEGRAKSQQTGAEVEERTEFSPEEGDFEDFTEVEAEPTAQPVIETEQLSPVEDRPAKLPVASLGAGVFTLDDFEVEDEGLMTEETQALEEAALPEELSEEAWAEDGQDPEVEEVEEVPAPRSEQRRRAAAKQLNLGGRARRVEAAEDYDEGEELSRDKGTRIALIVLAIIAVILLLFIAYSFFFDRDRGENLSTTQSSVTGLFGTSSQSSSQSVSQQSSQQTSQSLSNSVSPTPVPNQISPAADANVTTADPNLHPIQSEGGGAAATAQDQNQTLVDNGDGTKTYTIQSGDGSLWAIARQIYRLNDDSKIASAVESILALNPDKDPGLLQAGDKVLVPASIEG